MKTHKNDYLNTKIKKQKGEMYEENRETRFVNILTLDYATGRSPYERLRIG